MNENLETMLKSGGLKLAAMQAKNAEKDAKLEALRAAQAKNDGEKFLSLLPVGVHEYASFDHRFIFVCLPDAAQVAAEYRVVTERREYQGMSDLFISEIWLKEHSVSGKVWSLWRYVAVEGDVVIAPAGNGEDYAELDVALARAVQLGDGRLSAELDAAQQRADFRDWEAV